MQRAGDKRTEHLVIEAGVESEDLDLPGFPDELLVLLRVNLDLVDPGDAVGGFLRNLALRH